MSKIQLIEVKSEIGAGTRGASLGIDAIKIAALDFNSLYFKEHESIEIPNENRLLLESVLHEKAKRIEGIVPTYSRIAEKVKKVMKAGSFPLVLAGDHSSAGGTIAGIKAAYPKKKLGVIWIDAHADIHSPYTTPSGNVHGMPIAVSLAEDNKSSAVNKLGKETVQLWNELKSTAGIVPKIEYNDLVYVAVRDTEKPEDELIKKHSIKNISVNELRKKGVARTAVNILSALEHCDLIYISFDVDSMDPSISKGTGTPVSKGLTEKEAGKLITDLVKSKKVCCFEMVEVNPTLDKENLMAENAFEILQMATNQLKNRL